MVLGSLGSVYAAWIYDLAGSYHYAFISFILMTLPGLFLLRWLPPPLDATRSRNESHETKIMSKLSEKTSVIVIGSATGIGAATARLMAAEGSRVVLGRY